MAREIARSIAGKAAVIQINTEQNPHTAAKFAVRGIPAFFALKHGEAVSSLSGARPKEEIISWFLNAVR